MIWWLACKAPPVELDSPGQDPLPTWPAPAPTGPPPLSSPPELEDTDPDPDIVHVALVAEDWAYNGTVPGPTLRAQLGDTVIVDFQNDLPDPTTVHWHGLGVPADMDGAGWPMPEIPPGGSFTFTFEVQHAGTFWYHPHLDTEHQVDRGLYGVVIVEDPAEPRAEQELVLVLDTFGEPMAAESDPHLVDPMAVTWVVNGLLQPVWTIAGGQVVRVRLLNASNTGYLDLRDQTVIAHDQGLSAAPETGVVLAPGDRAELEWRVGDGFVLQSAPFAVAGGPALGEPLPLLEVRAEPVAAVPSGLVWPFGGEAPAADPGTPPVRFLLTGSPEGGWEMNGETFPDVTMPELQLGSEVVLEVRNVSPAHHPFHVHGHHFEVLSIHGVPPAHQQLEDTIDVPIFGIVRLLLVADNPGSWMTHCHVLPHAEGGMMTLLSVH
jgi:FtsP/CotA-like multicopper oxidase with cupredoxin domain